MGIVPYLLAHVGLIQHLLNLRMEKKRKKNIYLFYKLYN